MPETGPTTEELVLKLGTRFDVRIAEEVACLKPDPGYSYFIVYEQKGAHYHELVVLDGSLRRATTWYGVMEKCRQLRITGVFKISTSDLRAALPPRNLHESV